MSYVLAPRVSVRDHEAQRDKRTPQNGPRPQAQGTVAQVSVVALGDRQPSRELRTRPTRTTPLYHHLVRVTVRRHQKHRARPASAINTRGSIATRCGAGRRRPPRPPARDRARHVSPEHATDVLATRSDPDLTNDTPVSRVRLLERDVRRRARNHVESLRSGVVAECWSRRPVTPRTTRRVRHLRVVAGSLTLRSVDAPETRYTRSERYRLHIRSWRCAS